MRRFLALLGAGLRQNFGLALLKHKVLKQRRDLWLVLLCAAGLLGIIPVIVLYLQGSRPRLSRSCVTRARKRRC